MTWKRRGGGLTALSTVALALVTSGCASIVSGANQKIHLTSDPRRVHVEVRGQDDGELVWSGYTPTTVSLPRRQGYVLRATVDGFEPAEAEIETEVNGWFAANLLLSIGCVVGGAIDYATGAMWDLDPEHISFELVPSYFEEDEEEKGREYMVLLIRALDEEGEARQLALPLTRRSSAAN